MAICKFFQSGNCRFGDRCRYEHPGAGNQQPPRNNFTQGGGHQQQPRNNFQGNSNNFQGNSSRNAPNQNRFGSLESRIETPSGPRGNTRFGGNYVPPNQGQRPANQKGRGFQGNHDGRRGAFRPNKYDLTVDGLVAELRERPQWPLTCFGPGTNPPINLWGGEIEQSPEELRYHHYLELEQGLPSTSAQIEGEGAHQAAQFANSAFEDPAGAIEYIVNGESQPDNRHAITAYERHRFPLFSVDNYNRRRGVFEHIPRDKPNGNQQGFSRPSGGSNQTQGSGFNQQSAELRHPGGFRQQQGFGAGPGGFGQQPQNAFTAGPPQPTSGFGSFGQPNGGNQVQEVQMDAGMNSPTNMSFGQQGQPPFTNAFGQGPAAFGQQQQQQQNGNAFGSVQNNAPFGLSPPSQQQQQQSPQGAFGVQQPAFSTSQRPSAGGFGMQPGGFGVQPPQSGGFGQPSSNGFGSSQTGMMNGMGNGPMPSSGTGAAGPPLEPGSAREAAYNYMRQNGAFKDGIMPETAPPEDFIT